MNEDGGARESPRPSGETCCANALAAGLSRGDVGGVVCCGGVKVVCAWPSNLSRGLTNARARTIATYCSRLHEATHFEEIACTGAALERPDRGPGFDPAAEECIAYMVEANCVDAHLADCGPDADCRQQLTSRSQFKRAQAGSACGPG